MENFLNLDSIGRISSYLYKKTTTCDTVNNPFVPFFNLINGQKIVFDGRMLYEYNRYYYGVSDTIRQHRNDYLNLMRYIVGGNGLQAVKLGEVTYIVARGLLIEYENLTQEKTILALCIAKDSIFKFDRNNIDTSKMVLLVDYRFATEERYKPVFKKINTIYLTAARVHKIAIMYVDDVDSWCYNPNDEIKMKFRNVTQMKEYLNKFNSLTYGQAPEL